MKHLFDLNPRARIYVRFIFETFSMLAVYLFWLANIEGLGEVSARLHFLNVIFWIFAYIIFGLHKDRLRFSSLTSYLTILKVSFFYGAVLAVENLLLTGSLDIIVMCFVVLLILNILVGLRVVARQLIRREINKTRENILVYGTSDLAIDLVNAIAFGKRYNVVGFISENPGSIGSLAGLPIIRFRDVSRFASVNECKLVVLASSSLDTRRKADVLLKLDKLGLSVSYAPTMDRAFDYEIKLRAVTPDAVLGRMPEVGKDDTINTELHQKTILVTGAGGSIGSEICRQILQYQPEKLVILEINEFALYMLEQELSGLMPIAEKNIQVHYYLGSVADEKILNQVFKEHKINVVYHAAAYKHVPILEDNIIAALSNNVFGTKCLADIAHRFGVEKFVFVSTDKAVRPTSVMGASKRLAELIIQEQARSSNTVFTMVRFGNVLGSSGSVIPKFKSQIDQGGPITVTHKEITRYFMSIPEAARLVMNAGAFASGGDVFLLDMGDPVKITDLAKTMVRQHGLQPVLASEMEGRQKRQNEIAIEFSGLRPGEKLYEELLVDGIAQKTPNPKIFKSQDASPVKLDLANALQILSKNIQDFRINEIIEQLCELPLSYAPNISAESFQPFDVKSERTNTGDYENPTEQRLSPSLMNYEDHPSFLKRLVSSKFMLAILHKYFLFKRGMTLGVRVVVQNREGAILLVKHTYISGWHFPGGGVDNGEDAETAARREVFEETGLSELMDLKFIGLHKNNIVSKRDHIAFFKASTIEELSNTKTFEIAESRFVPRSQLMEFLSPEYLAVENLKTMF